MVFTCTNYTTHNRPPLNNQVNMLIRHLANHILEQVEVGRVPVVSLAGLVHAGYNTSSVGCLYVCDMWICM